MKQPRKRRDFCIGWKAFFYICVCLINYLLCVNTSVHVCRCLGIHMCIPWQHEHGIRGQFVGICFFLPLCEFQGSNIGSQASQQAPLYSEPLCWPSKMYLWIKRHHHQRWNSSASSKGKGASPSQYWIPCCREQQLSEADLAQGRRTKPLEQSLGQCSCHPFSDRNTEVSQWYWILRLRHGWSQPNGIVKYSLSLTTDPNLKTTQLLVADTLAVCKCFLGRILK